MKIRTFLFCFFLVFCVSRLCNSASPEYDETNTPAGKVILGLGRQEALEKFGLPASVSEDIWHYTSPESFFVYFSLASIHLYPEQCDTRVGIPLDLKAFMDLPNLAMEDVTSEIKLLISEPKDFTIERTGVIIPKKAGEYQILAKYKDIVSNTIYINVKEATEKKTEAEAETEKLLSIDILPYKPKASYPSSISFIALGTFCDYSRSKYFIRDISEKVAWFIQQGSNSLSAKGRKIDFMAPGKFKVFCKYNDLESFPQEVEIEDKYVTPLEFLKHITLLPELVIASSGYTISLKAFATYSGNRTEEITSSAIWRIKDKENLEMRSKGELLLKSEGVNEIIAQSGNLESSPSKIIIAGKATPVFAPEEIYKARKKNVHSQDSIIKDIMDDAKGINKDIFQEERKPATIKIIPGSLKIALGEERQLTALGLYNDSSQEDLTLLGEWDAQDNKVITVSKGKVTSRLSGESKVYVKFKGITSEPASVTVGGPRLVSIILTPQNLKLSMGQKVNLRAEGYFTDSSRKDITALVSWKLTRAGIVRIDKGRVEPLWLGATSVYAEYSGIKSLSSNIETIFTIEWLLSLILRAAYFLALSIIVIFLALYFLTCMEKDKLISSLKKNPQGFVIKLYENTRVILSIFGLSCGDSTPALHFAKLVKERYVIEDNSFLRFTQKFEEAKYSQRLLGPNDALLALNEYNNFLKALFSKYNKISLFLKYSLALCYRKPLCLS